MNAVWYGIENNNNNNNNNNYYYYYYYYYYLKKSLKTGSQARNINLIRMQTGRQLRVMPRCVSKTLLTYLITYVLHGADSFMKV